MSEIMHDSATILSWGSESGEGREDDGVAESQGAGGDGLAERGEVVLVGSTDLLDDSMQAESFEETGDLPAGFVEQGLKMAVAETADRKLAPNQGGEEVEVVTVEEIEAGIVVVVLANRPSHFLDLANPHPGQIESREELQIPSVGGVEQFRHHPEAMDGLADGGEVHRPGPVPMFHPAVVFEKGDIIHRGLDAQHRAVFVVHLEGGGSEVMADAGSLNAGVKVIAGLSREARVELEPQKHGHVLGLHRVDGGANQRLVEELQVLAGPKDDVGGILDLHQTPVNARAELPDDWTQFASVLIESAVELLDVEAVHDRLGLGEVVDAYEGVVLQGVADALFVELPCQPRMSVEIELQPEGGPGRDPQVAQTQVLVDEIEIVVEALGLPPFQEGLPRLLVVPGAKRRTGFHGREDVHQPRPIATLLQDGLDPFLLAEVFLGDVVDGQLVLGGQTLSVGADLIPQRLGELGVVEEADSADPQRFGHRLGVGDVDHAARDDDAVETGQSADDLVGVGFSERSHVGTLMPTVATRRSA